MPETVATVTRFPGRGGSVDVTLARGDVVLLTGPNGSGKTSLLRGLAGLASPSPLRAERVRVGGTDPSSIPAAGLAALVGMALQDPRETLVGLTVHGEFALRRMPLPAEVRPLADRDVATLSSGEARTVSLCVTQRSVPLLLLDEPTEGLDATRRAWLVDLVARAAATGAVVASDHSGLLTPLATRIVALGADPEGTLLRPAMPSCGDAPVLQADAVVARRDEARIALPVVSLPSGLHAIAGRNGSGKSTLLLHLAGLLDPGGVLIRGVAPTPGANVRLLLPGARDLFAQERVDLELAGCLPMGLVAPALLPRHPLSLSAGEAQRVALAKTLGRPSLVYLLDEPEAHLDHPGRTLLMDILAERIAAGACVVIATHDDELLAAAHSVLRLGGP